MSRAVSGVVVAAVAASAVVAGNRERAARPAPGEWPVETCATVVFLSGSEFFNWARAGVPHAAAQLGPHVRVELQGPAEWDAALEARTIEPLVARKLDAARAKTQITAVLQAHSGISGIFLYRGDVERYKHVPQM